MMWRKISAFSKECMPWTRRSVLLALFFNKKNPPQLHSKSL